MESITVNKADLLAKLQENRDNHRAEFLKALDGWRITAEAESTKLAEEAKAGKLKLAFLSLPRPEDHTSDYDRRIQMYEMDINTTVELEEHEFAQYVQDDWGWRKQWTTSNSTYMAASSR
jgi:hypothetical protein